MVMKIRKGRTTENVRLTELIAHLNAAPVDKIIEFLERIKKGENIGQLISSLPGNIKEWQEDLGKLVAYQFEDADRPIVEIVANAVDAVKVAEYRKRVDVTLCNGYMEVKDEGLGMNLAELVIKLL